MGAGANSVIQELSDLTKTRGDRIHVHLQMKLDGSGVTGDNTLKGNEEQLVLYQDTITIDQLRNGVAYPGRLEAKKAAYDIMSMGRDALVVWLAETMDQILINHVCGLTTETFPAAALAPSANRKLYAGTATADGNLTDTAADRMTVEEISRARYTAETANPLIRPIMVGGEPHYVMLMHPNQAFDLFYTDGTGSIATMFRDNIKDAKSRGDDNPAFKNILSGAFGMWDGVILHSNRNVPIITTGGGSANVAYAPLMGAQAAAIAFGEAPTWGEEEDDFGNKKSVGYGQIFGVKKMRFNSEDFGVLVVATNASAVAGTAHT
jgi:N4-gp56 family major capsid protein